MTATRRATPAQALRSAVNQVRAVLPVAPAPRYVEADPDPTVGWLLRLDRVRAALEQARVDLLEQGWTGGGWFAVPTASGTRVTTGAEAFDVLRSRSTVSGACLVGTLLRRADDPDRATSIADVWGCVDELVEALHEGMGHHAFAPGRSYSAAERYGRLRVLTAWNDEPGRTREQVVTLVDRAISRTLVGACAR